MRNLIVATALVLASTSAFALPKTRGLSTAEPPKSVAVAEVPQVQDTPKPSVADQLKALGETPKPQVKAQEATALPSIEVESPVANAAKASNARDAKAEIVQRKRTTSRTVRRESSERKARRYAGYFGIRW